MRKGQTSKNRLEWKEASDYWTKESPVARGNNFNKKCVLLKNIHIMKYI